MNDNERMNRHPMEIEQPMAAVQKHISYEKRERDGEMIEVTHRREMVKDGGNLTLTFAHEIMENQVKTELRDVLRLEEREKQFWLTHEKQMLQGERIVQKKKTSTCLGDSKERHNIVTGRLCTCFSKEEEAAV